MQMDLLHLDSVREIATNVVRELLAKGGSGGGGGSSSSSVVVSDGRFLELLPRALQIISRRDTGKGMCARSLLQPFSSVLLADGFLQMAPTWASICP